VELNILIKVIMNKSDLNILYLFRYVLLIRIKVTIFFRDEKIEWG
jgi:hypothetical protein